MKMTPYFSARARLDAHALLSALLAVLVALALAQPVAAGGATDDVDPTAAQEEAFGEDATRDIERGAATTVGGASGVEPVTGNAPSVATDAAVEAAPVADSAASPAEPPLKIRVAAIGERAPFFFRGESGELQGTLVDIWQLVAVRAGAELEFVTRIDAVEALDEQSATAIDEAVFDAVRNGEVDAHIGVLEPPDAVADIAFTLPVQIAETGVFHHRGIADVRVPEQLSAYRVGVVAGSEANDWLAGSSVGVDVVTYPDRDQLVDAALAGQVRVFAADGTTTLHYLRSRGVQAEFVYQDDQPLFERDIRAAVAVDDAALLGRINEGLSLITNAERVALTRAWTRNQRDTMPGKVTVVMVGGNAPYSFAASTGQANGLLADVWQLWSSETKTPVDFIVASDADTAIAKVLRGEADLHAGLLPSEASEARLGTGASLYEVSTLLVYRAEDEGAAPDLDASTPPTVGVLEGSRQQAYIERSYPHLKTTDFTSWESMLRYLAWGSVDLVLAERGAALDAIRNQGLGSTLSSSPIEGPGLAGPLVLAFRADDTALGNMVDAGMAKIDGDALARIERRWVETAAARIIDSDGQTLVLSPNERSWRRENPVLRVGLAGDGAPFVAANEAGGLVGIDPDYLYLLEDRLGVEFALRADIPRTDVFSAVERGDVDLVIGATRSDARDAQVDFTASYANDPAALFARGGGERTLEGLSGNAVAALAGDSATARARADHPDIEWVEVTSLADGIERLARGEVEALMAGAATATRALSVAQGSGIEAVGSTPYDRPLFVAARKDDEMLGSILGRAVESVTPEERADIRSRWAPALAPGETDSAPSLFGKFDNRLLAIAAAVALGLALLVGGLLGSLRARRNSSEANYSTRREDDLRSVVDNAAVGLATLGPRYEVQTVNPAFSEMTGFTQSELQGRKLPELLETDPNSQLTDRSRTREGDERLKFERHYRDKSGVAHWAEVTTTWIRGSDGKRRAIATVSNIDARKKAEAESERRAREAAEQQALATVAGADVRTFATPEFRVPMHGLVQMLDEVARRGDADARGAMAGSARDAAATLAHMFDDMRSAQGTELALRPEACDVETLLEGVLDTTAPGAAHLGVRLSNAVSNTLPVAVLLDPARFSQVALHLLSHGIEAAASSADEGATAPPVHVALEWAPSDVGATGELQLSVTHSGQGLDSEEASALADPGTSTEDLTGPVVGLVRCRRVAESMSGSLEVDDRVVAGHVVARVRVPATVVEQHTFESRLANEEETRPLRLLVVASDDTQAECVRHAVSFWHNSVERLASLELMYQRLAEAHSEGPALDVVIIASDAEFSLTDCLAVRAQMPNGRTLAEQPFVVLAPDVGAAMPERHDATTLLVRSVPLRRRQLMTAVAALGGVIEAGPSEVQARPSAAIGALPAPEGATPSDAATVRAAAAAVGHASEAEAAPTADTARPAEREPTDAEVEAYFEANDRKRRKSGATIEAETQEDFDLEGLASTFDDDRELVGDLLDEFVWSSRERLADMQRGLYDQDAGKLAAAAGELRDSSLGVGANALAKVCRELVEAGNANDWGRIDALAPSLTTEMRKAIAVARGFDRGEAEAAE